MSQRQTASLVVPENARKWGELSSDRTIEQLCRTGWWARQDSNLEPSGYEPLALTIELQARQELSGYLILFFYASASR